jgi:hypothetical protein
MASEKAEADMRSVQSEFHAMDGSKESTYMGRATGTARLP